MSQIIITCSLNLVIPIKLCPYSINYCVSNKTFSTWFNIRKITSITTTPPTNNILFCYHMIICYFRFGPLVRHWTMRYEAKHSYFKSLSQTLGNYINLPYSLAMRYQQYQCYIQSIRIQSRSDEITTGPGTFYYLF